MNPAFAILVAVVLAAAFLIRFFVVSLYQMIKPDSSATDQEALAKLYAPVAANRRRGVTVLSICLFFVCLAVP